MDWSNERYVRWYTRDTKTWLLLGWQGQCVLGLIMRKVDRSGVLDDVADGADLAVIFANGMPVEHIQFGLDRLTKYGVAELTPAGLVLPNFIEAQEAAQSDAQRARESRERKRAASRNVTEPSRDATNESQPATVPSQPVTGCHSASQPVTPSVPSVPSVPDERKERAGATSPPRVQPPRPDRFGAAIAGSGPGTRKDVQELHSAWRTAFGRTGATLRHATGDDAYALAEAIDAHGLPDCLLVAREAPRDGMVNGSLDDKSAKHESIRYIFGNEETFSRILAAAKKNAAPARVKTIQDYKNAGRL